MGGSGLCSRPGERAGGRGGPGEGGGGGALDSALRAPRRQVVPASPATGGALAAAPRRFLRTLGPAPRELAGGELRLSKERISSDLGFWCLKRTQATGFTVCHSHCPLQRASRDPGADQPPTDAQVAPGTVACCKAKASQRLAGRLPRTRKIKVLFLFSFGKKKKTLLYCPTPIPVLQITKLQSFL